MLSAAHPPDDVRVVVKEGAALAAAGWRVRHLCPSGAAAPPAMVAGVAIESFARAQGRWARLRGIPALARRAASSGATVLHASEPDAWVAAWLAARRGGARLVIDVHEHYPSRLDGVLPGPLRPPARAALRLFCRAMAARADAVVVAKDGLAEDFGRGAGCVPVRNHADALPVAPRRHRAGPLRLVHLGALTRARGWPEMLAALALTQPDTRLVLLGRFTDGSEAAFTREADRLGLTARIERHGWQPRVDALAMAAGCDVGLVLFQRGEENHRLALPHKLFDCMLAGLPVIAPAFATEVAAVVRAAGCGVLVDSGDPRAISAAVEDLADPALRARLGAAGREAALTRFSWSAEAVRLVALYDRLAPLAPPPACAAPPVCVASP
nr:glycosyltransferase [Plastoroseomonas arctica]